MSPLETLLVRLAMNGLNGCVICAHAWDALREVTQHSTSAHEVFTGDGGSNDAS
jgi:hypothetical protein